MSKLSLHNQDITSIFQLLGENENDITYSTGWVLSRSKVFLEKFIKKVIGKKIIFEDALIRLQEYREEDKGFTDIEIYIEGEVFIIIEAKQGWNLPDKKQLLRYINRFSEYRSIKNKLVVISECKKDYAKKELNKFNLKIPMTFISWQSILNLIEEIYSEVGNYEKRLLSELFEYLRGVITMKDIKSNMVYCVSLGHYTPKWSKISWIDIVEKKNKYFYPVGAGWPSEPPNYMAFRYDSKLQAIRHVESYEIVEQLHDKIPEIKPDSPEKLRYVLKLGPAFKPEKEVKNGNIWPNGRLWCMLDTFFTCDTIRDARDLTKKRLGED